MFMHPFCRQAFDLKFLFTLMCFRWRLLKMFDVCVLLLLFLSYEHTFIVLVLMLFYQLFCNIIVNLRIFFCTGSSVMVLSNHFCMDFGISCLFTNLFVFLLWIVISPFSPCYHCPFFILWLLCTCVHCMEWGQNISINSM